MILKRKWERNQTLRNDKKKKKKSMKYKGRSEEGSNELQVRKELAKWQE